MKRAIGAILGLVAMSTAASADLVCQSTYVKKWSNYYGNWIIQQGPEQCYDAETPPQYAPPPAPGYPPVYEAPIAPVAGYPAADLLVGGLIGAGIGYAIGNNNNTKKKYYYYNNNNNYWHGNGHKKRYLYPGGWNNGEGRKQPKNYKKHGNNN